MLSSVVTVCIFVTLLVNPCVSKIVSRCDVANAFRKGGANPNEINDWICIAEHESSLNTKAINEVNSDGSWDYGIVQINSRYWCQGQVTQSNGCNVRCKDLLGDSMAPSVACALKIRQQQGLTAWVAWNNNCSGRDLSEYGKGC